MFETYLLESYMISDDPEYIAIEASIEGELGNGKLGRKAKRLLSAAKNGDEKTARQLKDELTEDAKKVEAAARKEKNLQLAKSAIGIAARAISLGSMIYSLVNSGKESKEWNKITASGNGATSQQVAFINGLRNRREMVNKVSTGFDIASGLLSML